MAYLIKRPEDGLMFALVDKGPIAEHVWTNKEDEAFKFFYERDANTYAKHMISRPSVADPLIVTGCNY